MTVIELINLLQDMPHNSEVFKVIHLRGQDNIQHPHPEMVWDDENSKFVVVI